MAKDTVPKTLLVATILCVACSVCVSVAAVFLRPAQEKNRALDRKRNILMAAGMYEEGMDVEAAFSRIETRLVDFETGNFVEDVDPNEYDQREAAKAPETSIAVTPEQDIASVRRRAKLGVVYLVKNDREGIETVILPVRGMGLWGTMYGFMALRGDMNEVAGLGFYEHIETPGLGGEVDNPRWKKQWVGKEVLDGSGDLAIEVIKGTVDPAKPEAKHQIDGLAGATITTRGVSNLVRYWLGENGYGPLLARLRESHKSAENSNG